jgi:hypothetical protein
MLLHWDGNMDSYYKFTSHLDQTNLIFGLNEEFAAVKAVNLSFPNATRVLCAKQINKTVRIKKIKKEQTIKHELFFLLFPPPLDGCVWIKLNFYFTTFSVIVLLSPYLKCI